ncbi:4179_t:CDS:2 [Scutellospora calospora]|uniref:4179_t:CDS:1 n=1 Tax=Scutellospora calospora TaxID=85575 RepID=A0ACA9KNQ7_9GLOM|nr:4179_t:CDS:2 [Scutellospora calospora]
MEDNNRLEDFFSEIVKEVCNLYNEERSKGKSSKQILDMLDIFIAKKNQDSKDIINWCLNDKINPTVQNINDFYTDMFTGSKIIPYTKTILKDYPDSELQDLTISDASNDN